MAQKTFLFDEPVALPAVLSIHAVDDRFLIVAPEHGNWITVDRLGLGLVRQLERRLVLREAVAAVAQSAGLSFDDALDRVSYTLRAIEANQFYQRPVSGGCASSNGYALHLYASMQCNLRCVHCYVRGGVPLPDELTTSEILTLLDACARCGFQRFTLSGGEPLLRPDWRVILEHANTVGLSCFLLTNGTLIGDLQTAQAIARLTEEVQVSLDGATQGVNDLIRGAGSYRQALRGAELLVEAGARVFIAMTMMEQNVRDLEDNVKALAGRLGEDAVAFRFARLESAGRAKGLPVMSDSQTAQAGKRILQSLVGPELWTDCYSLPRRRAVNCGYGASVALSADGFVYPCASLYRPVGSIRQERFEDLHARVQQQHRGTAVDRIRLCADCDLRYICTGGCRIRNDEQNGTMLQPVCSAAHKRAFYRRLSCS